MEIKKEIMKSEVCTLMETSKAFLDTLDKGEDHLKRQFELINDFKSRGLNGMFIREIVYEAMFSNRFYGQSYTFDDIEKALNAFGFVIVED